MLGVGAAASAGLEQAAQAGSSAGLIGAFAAAGSNAVQNTLAGGPAFPGSTQTLTGSYVDLSGSNRYLSYAAMAELRPRDFLGNTAAVDLSALANGSMLMFAGLGLLGAALRCAAVGRSADQRRSVPISVWRVRAPAPPRRWLACVRARRVR